MESGHKLESTRACPQGWSLEAVMPNKRGKGGHIRIRFFFLSSFRLYLTYRGGHLGVPPIP